MLRLLVAAMAVVATGSIAWAQSNAVWSPREKLVERLDVRWNESPAFIALVDSPPSHVIEVFLSKGGETWTLVLSRPAGYSKILASGTYWMLVPKKTPTTETAR